MQQKISLKIVIAAAFAAFVLNLFFGRYITAKLSTLPILNRFKILNPQTPIVINTKEEIRVDDNADPIKSLADVRPKLSAIFSLKNGQPSLLGGALNLTNDGVVVAPASILPAKKRDADILYIKFYDGRHAKVVSETIDPYTGLVFLKTEINNLSVANFFDSKQLVLGQKLIAVSANLGDQSAGFLQTNVAGFRGADDDSVFESDLAGEGFVFADSQKVLSGSVLASANGEVAGMWNGVSNIPSKQIKNASQLYIRNQKIIRPSFGFSYKILQNWQQNLLEYKEAGILVFGENALAPGGPAFKAGLKPGDLITAVDNVKMSGQKNPEDMFLKYAPGDKVEFKVLRGVAELKLNLIVGELK